MWITGQRRKSGEFPDGPGVRNPSFHAEGPGSIPGQGTKIPKALRYSQGEKEERGKKRLRASCGQSVLPVRLGLPLSPPLTGLMSGRRAATHYPTPGFTVYLSNAISSHPSPSSTPQTFLHPMSAQTSTARPWASSLSGTASLRNG